MAELTDEHVGCDVRRIYSLAARHDPRTIHLFAFHDRTNALMFNLRAWMSMEDRYDIAQSFQTIRP